MNRLKVNDKSRVLINRKEITTKLISENIIEVVIISEALKVQVMIETKYI